jgi:hypothetical protein
MVGILLQDEGVADAAAGDARTMRKVHQLVRIGAQLTASRNGA